MGLVHRRTRLAIGTLTLAFGAAGLTAPPAAAQGKPPEDPRRGMKWDGLAPGRSEHRCAGAWEIRGRAGDVLGCTHGPDPAPKDVDVTVEKATPDLEAEAAALPLPPPGPGTNGDGIACAGDGTSGFRVEAIYAVPSGLPDRFDQIAPVIRSSYAPFVEWQYQISASETGGEAHVPFVTTPDAGGCTVVVRHEVLSSTGDDSFANTMSELKARGYNRADRRYMVWMDASTLCGIGQIYRDNQPGQANANNGYYTAFGRVDTACWGYGEAHELMHNLGGVQPEAPNATPGFHCRDENDQMCYDDDGSGPVVMQSVCAGRDNRLFDCRHDDYFLAGSPPAGTWLATHWNTYNSRFILRGPSGPPSNVAPVVDAGPNRSAQPNQQVSLDGNVTDDGLPAGAAVTTSWTKTSGPGTVTFAAVAAVDTTATVSSPGTYTLSLTASDTQLSTSDTMTVTVSDPNASVTESFSGSFNKNRRLITHTFSSGPGLVTVTVNGPSNRSLETTLYAPDGSVLGRVSGSGTRTLSATGPSRGSYRLTVGATSGSYTASVQHPA